MTFIQHIARSAAKQRRIITLNYVQIKVSLINYFLLGPEPDTQKIFSKISPEIANRLTNAQTLLPFQPFHWKKEKSHFPFSYFDWQVGSGRCCVVYSGVSVFDGKYYLVLATCVTLRTFESTKYSGVIFSKFRHYISSSAHLYSELNFARITK